MWAMVKVVGLIIVACIVIFTAFDWFVSKKD